MIFEYPLTIIDEVYDVTEADRKKCRSYANGKDVSHYVRNRLANEDQARRNSYIGKLGQVIAHRFLTYHGIDCSDPDFRILPRRKKSWDTFLRCPGDRRVHVKSCNQQTLRFGESWTFQLADAAGNGGRDAIYDVGTRDDFYLFVTIDETSNTAIVRALVSWAYICEANLLTVPRIQNYSGIKQVVYYHDLISSAKSDMILQ